MLPALLVRLRPMGPWRFGPATGARDRVDRILHSDSLYSAVTQAISVVGPLEDWIDATARSASPAVRLTSMYPYMGRHMYITPPRSIWPPPPTARVRWKGARLLPISLVQSLLRGETLDEEKWAVDPISECLLPIEKNYTGIGPFRIALRSAAAVDRLNNGNVEVHRTACLEFADQCGLWCAAAFADDAAKSRWTPVLRSAFRFLADEGIGGERSRGWGRAKPPRFEDFTLSTLFFPGEGVTDPVFWMLSLYNPAEDDGIDWSVGNYSVVPRGHFSDPRRQVRFLEEGSVARALRIPTGQTHDLAGADSPHPIYRSGLAVAIPIPSAIRSVSVKTVEEKPEKIDVNAPVAPPSPDFEFPDFDMPTEPVAEPTPAPPAEPEPTDAEPGKESEPGPTAEPTGAPEPTEERKPDLESEHLPAPEPSASVEQGQQPEPPSEAMPQPDSSIATAPDRGTEPTPEQEKPSPQTTTFEPEPMPSPEPTPETEPTTEPFAPSEPEPPPVEPDPGRPRSPDGDDWNPPTETSTSRAIGFDETGEDERTDEPGPDEVPK